LILNFFIISIKEVIILLGLSKMQPYSIRFKYNGDIEEIKANTLLVSLLGYVNLDDFSFKRGSEKWGI